MSVTLDQLHFVHSNGWVALERIQLQVRTGEHVALIGPSGAGKTTLLSVMGARLAPTRGHVTVLDQADGMQDERSLRLLRPRIGSIYQSPPLAGRLGVWPAWKSLASLFYPMDINGASKVLSQVQLSDKLFDRCDQLSGGQLQRVGMARVLYQQADLVLSCFPRIVGLRDGDIAFDLPAKEVTQAMLNDLFANEATQAKDGNIYAANNTLLQQPA